MKKLLTILVIIILTISLNAQKVEQVGGGKKHKPNTKLQDAKDKIIELQIEIQNLESNLELMNSLKIQNRKLRKRNKKLQDKVDLYEKYKYQNINLKKKLKAYNKYQTQNIKLKRQISSLQDDINLLNDEILELNKTIRRLEKQLSTDKKKKLKKIEQN